jgi:predicted ester cyclase
MASPDQNEAVVRRFYDELWNQWRVHLIDEIVADDVRFRGSLGTSLVGRDAFRDYVQGVRGAFPDWNNQIDELLVVGDRVVTRMTWTGTHKGKLADLSPTGARVSYVGAAFFRTLDAVITEAWVVGDTQEIWRALGRL